MATSFLSQFLDLGLLPGIDDANFGKLEAAADSLAGTLQSDAYALRRYSYALLDADLSDDDPVLVEVENVVKEEWRTLRSSHPARPIQLLRAVLGHALSKATADASFQAEAILWLTASSVLPYSRLGPERHLIVKLFEKFGREAEEKAIAAWEISSGGTSSVPKLPPPPTFKVNAVDGDQSAPAADVQKALNQVATYLGAVSANVSSVQKDYFQWSSNYKSRIDLLWWKEALYSPSLQGSYRSVGDPVATLVTLAYDFYNLLPNTYPHSAEYFFREVIYQVLGRETKHRWHLTEFCAQMMANERSIRLLSGKSRSAHGRVPLLAFLNQLTRREVDPADAPSRVGIGDEVLLGADDFAVWVLRELQASHLANEKAEEK